MQSCMHTQKNTATKIKCPNISSYLLFSCPHPLKQGLKSSRLPLKFCIAQYDLELHIFLLLPPKCWNGRCVPPRHICAKLGIEPGSLCVLDKCFTNGDKSLCPHHQLLTRNFWQGALWLGIECVCPFHQHLLKMTEKKINPVEVETVNLAHTDLLFACNINSQAETICLCANSGPVSLPREYPVPLLTLRQTLPTQRLNLALLQNLVFSLLPIFTKLLFTLLLQQVSLRHLKR